LDQTSIKRTLAFYVHDTEIKGILGRRDQIVRIIEDRGTKDGAEKVIYERPAR